MKTATSFALLAALLAVPALTQQGTVIRVPLERGVYYDSPGGTVALPTRLFMPLQNSSWTELLAVGVNTKLRAVVPGGHAAISITDKRPTFYLRGDRPGNDLYLVRGTQKGDRREFRFKRDKLFSEWIEFRAEDLTEVDMEPLAGDLVRVRPRVDLTPGEYVFVAALEPRFRAVKLAFDFGVPR